jgi:hypothetical protein
MNKIILIIILLFSLLQSCTIVTTREEEDLFTITEKDTTVKHFIKNAPGNKDRGVVHPSTKEILSEREITQRDSTVNRYYPDFIRLGLFEGMGLIGGNSDFSLNSGIFGVYPDPALLDKSARGEKGGSIFTGGIYRLGIYENRLRWFQDAENWTWGLHGVEAIIPDARVEKGLIGMFTPYIRKRYYFRDDIPYVSATIAVGMGFFPSQYANVSGSIDVGSLGGVNVRTYVGFAAGYNSKSSLLIEGNDFATEGIFNTIPYAGLSVSVLDFVNVVPELYTEWKDHEHSSWKVGLADITFVNTNSEYSAFGDNSRDSSTSIIKGYFIRLANAQIAIPINGNYNLYAGTSLLSLYIMGLNGNGIGVLPLRVGYWHQLLKDELSIDPYIEYGYYPSSYINIGANLRLRFSDKFNLGIIGGYISGNTLGGIGSQTLDFLGSATSFDGYYIGLSFSFLDRIFYPEELRYAE